jgi:indolepyruvate ferredoxin oxidoreductase
MRIDITGTALPQVSLSDKYLLRSGRIYLNGTQALIRLALQQARIDREQGFNTRGFVTGYRGSPLGGIDQAMDAAKDIVKAEGIVFRPGVNEDLAATAVLGTQQINVLEKADCEGVFSIWYGKGPGVDRSGDALKHGNLSGSAPKGGVLLLLGDDHTCKSSTTSHQSEFGMVDAMIPTLNPSGVSDIIPFGLYGIALSRFSGCWTAMKLVAETMDSSASIPIDESEGHFVTPDFDAPQGGLHIRWPDSPQEQERRLHLHKHRAVHAFARANRIDQSVWPSSKKRIGIVSTGKSWLDVLQALELLGIDEARAEEIGLSLYKVGLVWPLEPHGLKDFADGLDTVLVVEEKRPLLEGQIKDLLYDMPKDRRPRILGKQGPDGSLWLPSHDDLGPSRIAQVIGTVIANSGDTAIRNAIDALATIEGQRASLKPSTTTRAFYFCAGCPHSTSTRVPEGSRGMAGIGCHFMATTMDRATAFYTHMGAEGANWIGQFPFVPTKHIFQNIGDGTYFHSGLLAIRAAISAKVNITYKILFNDAVAMTGGQKHDGPLSPDRIAWQVRAEGVERIAIVADDPTHLDSALFPPGTTIAHRDELDSVQRELREIEGTSVIVYDQICASEKRRRQKRGLLPKAETRVLINDLVCEGCGDCSKKSNCVAVAPLDTEFGTKRRIDQSNCNTDLSCLKGFCPSFVTIEGGVAKASTQQDLNQILEGELPYPAMPALDRPWNIFVAGVGGTGVVTIGAILAMAAHVENKGASTLDHLGMTQRGGSVTSHIRIAATPDDLNSVRIPSQKSDLLIAADIVTALGQDCRASLAKNLTHIVLNTAETITGQFVRNRDARFSVPQLQDQLLQLVDHTKLTAFDANGIARVIVGDALGANMMLVGFALQKGLIPLTPEAIEQAITLNGTAIGMNLKAFRLGRHIAADSKLLSKIVKNKEADLSLDHRRLSETLEDKIARRADYLDAYQNRAYGNRYRTTLDRVMAAESRIAGKPGSLSETVAKALFHLMAIKDEYEIARLYTSPAFKAQIADQFASYAALKIYLAPPGLTKINPATGEPEKHAFGAWILPVFSILARLKGLRGTVFDVFGMTEERKREKRWRERYFTLLDEVLNHLSESNLPAATALLAAPLEIRGFGHVRAAAMTKVETEMEMLRAQFFENPLVRAAE